MSKTCTKCLVTYENIELNFSKQKLGAGGRRPNCKACIKLESKKYHEDNKERNNERNREYKRNNKDKEAAYRKSYKEAHKEQEQAYKKKYYHEHREAIKQYNDAWAAANQDRRNACAAKRRCKKLSATPEWSSSNSIQAFYSHARLLTELNGSEYHVDHFIPLQHKLVCGLHVPANLRVIKGSENCAKSNKFKPYGFDFTTGLHYELV